MMYKPLGITHGNKTLIAIRTKIISGPYIDYWLPACWFCFFFISIILCIFFSSKRNRKFPLSTMGFMLVFDLLYFLREIFRGSPFEVISETLLWNPSETTCALLYIWLMWADAASYVMGVFLCLFIYKIIVQKVDLKTDKKLFWKFTASFFVYSFIYSTIIGLVARTHGYGIIGTGCGPKEEGASITGLFQSVVAAAIQITLLSLVLRYMTSVASSVPGSPTNSKKNWFAFRFFLLVVCESIPRLYFNAFYMHRELVKQIPSDVAEASTLTLYVLASIFYLLASIVVLCSHKLVWRWAVRRVYSVKEIVAMTRSRGLSSLSSQENLNLDHSTVTVGALQL